MWKVFLFAFLVLLFSCHTRIYKKYKYMMIIIILLVLKLRGLQQYCRLRVAMNILSSMMGKNSFLACHSHFAPIHGENNKQLCSILKWDKNFFQYIVLPMIFYRFMISLRIRRFSLMAEKFAAIESSMNMKNLAANRSLLFSISQMILMWK